MRTYPGLPDLYSRLPELDMKFGSVNVRIRNQDLEFIDIVVASSIEGRSLQFDQKIFKDFSLCTQELLLSPSLLLQRPLILPLR